MNIVNKLTLRHMRENKRRTLVTLIGVIISVAMVTAVATLFVSFMDLLQRQEMANNGEWHVEYKNVDQKQLKAIEKDSATKSVSVSRDVGYAILKGSQNESKPYLFILEYNNEAFKKFPIQLTSGRLPKAPDEVVLSGQIAENAKVHYKIGDRLTLAVGEREGKENGQMVRFDQDTELQTLNGIVTETLKTSETKTYTVTGFIKRPDWERGWAPGYTVLSYVDDRLMDSDTQVNAFVVLKTVNHSLYAHADELAQKNGIKSVDFNRELLRYYGVTNNEGLGNTFLWLSVIIIAIIVIGSVALIFNAFAISVSERSRHLGMLSSVGATKRQKRNSVFFEGAVIGLISIPLGLLFGVGGIGATLLLINSILQGALELKEGLRLIVTPLSILTACSISVVTIFISIYIPARKASRVSAIDAIRQTADVKLTRRAVKTSKLVRRMFGFEAEIGLKNLKRNKRRYQATVFSLVISIVLFLSVSYFTMNLKKSITLSQGENGYDIQVSKNGKMHTEDEQLFVRMSGLDDVSGATEVKVTNAETWLDKASAADEFRKPPYNQQFTNGKVSYMVNFYSLDEKSLKAYAKKAGADYRALIDRKRMAGIVIDTIRYRDRTKFVESKALHAKAGQRLAISNMEEKKLGSITIAALSDQVPLGVPDTGLGNLSVIVSEQVLEQLIKGQPEMEPYSALYLKSSDPMRTQAEIDKIKSPNMAVWNIYKQHQQSDQMIMIMSVFSYGFIALITLISVANIFNTISTSIGLRKREFAMLRSVGMTPKGFNKMINYESIFYGMKSLLYGLPFSIGVMYLIYLSMMNSYSYGFELPWLKIIGCLCAVFVIVGVSMLYSSSKIKKENIIDALKQENI